MYSLKMWTIRTTFRYFVGFVPAEIKLLDSIMFILSFIYYQAILFLIAIDVDVNLERKWTAISWFNFSRESNSLIYVSYPAHLFVEELAFSLSAIIGDYFKEKFQFASLGVLPWVMHALRLFFRGLFKFFTIATIAYETKNFNLVLLQLFVFHLIRGYGVYAVILQCADNYLMTNIISNLYVMHTLRNYLIKWSLRGVFEKQGGMKIKNEKQQEPETNNEKRENENENENANENENKINEKQAEEEEDNVTEKENVTEEDDEEEEVSSESEVQKILIPTKFKQTFKPKPKERKRKEQRRTFF